tara:strand:- start:2614 stop:2778 length:165 start_codon:yes stop_codon:yes gene_type:complete
MITKKTVDELIREIQIKENLTLPEVFAKYPHLAELQKEELFTIKESNQKQLLKG